LRDAHSRAMRLEKCDEKRMTRRNIHETRVHPATFVRNIDIGSLAVTFSARQFADRSDVIKLTYTRPEQR